ncbi:MAG: hypothetical protein KKC66_04200 [Candidatus Omnitrophica bacterium]|nr:hypothetical protein [Candidatus Omnitrophota bacterium]MBU1933082.1 hypothetical protein [Candidatus Omnitrophota bacterium]
MQNKKIITLIILGILAVFSLVYGIVTPSKARRGISRGPIETKKKVTISAGAETISGVGRPQRTSFSDWGRDPFSAVSTLSLSTNISDMSLTGILWDDVAPLAMINDNLIGIGDKIGEYTVAEIKKDRVILTDGTNDYQLTLPY